jgi:ATP-dependent protease HslVU (ClpYQ) peptidase subunit
LTLCIAATCLDRKKPRIVVSSDWRTELATLAAVEVHNRLYWLFKGSWCVLIAGSVPSALSLLMTIRQSIDPKKLKRRAVEDELNKAVLKHKSKLVKRYIKSRHNVSLKYLRAHKSEFDKGTWTETLGAIEKVSLDCSLIVCTFVKSEPLIFQVNEDASVIRQENFTAIGTGGELANSILCYRRQHGELTLEETTYNVFEATKFARKARVPGVGKVHAFSVLAPKRKQKRLRQGAIRKLEKYFDKYGPQEIADLKLPKKHWENY